MKYDHLLDAKGMVCPMPLLKAKQSLNQMQSQERLLVLCTDAASKRDFNAFAKLSGHELSVNTVTENELEIYQFLFVKK